MSAADVLDFDDAGHWAERFDPEIGALDTARRRADEQEYLGRVEDHEPVDLPGWPSLPWGGRP